MAKKDKLIASFDTNEIIDNAVKFQMEEGDDRNGEEIRESVLRDSDFFEEQMEFFLETVTEKMKRMTQNNVYGDYFHVRGEQMGWRNLSGETVVRADDARELFDQILPKTDVKIWVYDWGNRGMKMRVAQHDSPMGEWYYVSSMNKKEVEEYEERV